jgi:hypothetical protein
VCKAWRRAALLQAAQVYRQLDVASDDPSSRMLLDFSRWMVLRLGPSATVTDGTEFDDRPPELQLALEHEGGDNRVAIANIMAACSTRFQIVRLHADSWQKMSLDWLCVPLLAATELSFEADSFELTNGLAHLSQLRRLRLKYQSCFHIPQLPPWQQHQGPHAAAHAARRTSLCLPAGLTALQLLCELDEDQEPSELPPLSLLFSKRHEALVELQIAGSDLGLPTVLDGLAHLTSLTKLCIVA